MSKSVPGPTNSAHPALVSPHPEQVHVFTKDLKQLIADLQATDDKAAMTQRYKDALVAKRQVRREFSSCLGSVVLKYLES